MGAALRDIAALYVLPVCMVARAERTAADRGQRVGIRIGLWCRAFPGQRGTRAGRLSTGTREAAPTRCAW